MLTSFPNAKLWALFQLLWTRDVGRDGYCKSDWMALEWEVLELVKQNRELQELNKEISQHVSQVS